MENRRVKDVMILVDEYPHVSTDSTLLEAMETMDEARVDFNGRSSLPRVVLVFDRDSKLCGVARRRDLMRGLLPPSMVGQSWHHSKEMFSVEMDSILTEVSYKSLAAGIHDRAQKCVSGVMRPIENTVDYDDHITTVIFCMVKNDLSIIPVVIGEKVVGVVRSVDVLHEIAGLLLAEAENC